MTDQLSALAENFSLPRASPSNWRPIPKASPNLVTLIRSKEISPAIVGRSLPRKTVVPRTNPSNIRDSTELITKSGPDISPFRSRESKT